MSDITKAFFDLIDETFKVLTQSINILWGAKMPEFMKGLIYLYLLPMMALFFILKLDDKHWDIIFPPYIGLTTGFAFTLGMYIVGVSNLHTLAFIWIAWIAATCAAYLMKF